MNLREELQPLFNSDRYRNLSAGAIERIAGLGQGTLSKALLSNNISVKTLAKLGAPAGYSFGLKLKEVN